MYGYGGQCWVVGSHPRHGAAWPGFPTPLWPWGFFFFSNLLNPSSRNTAVRLTQLLTEKSTMNLPGGKALPARKADNLTPICEPIV
jgi:hypothetical protein